jgi:hypothetical protein
VEKTVVLVHNGFLNREAAKRLTRMHKKTHPFNGLSGWHVMQNMLHR